MVWITDGTAADTTLYTAEYYTANYLAHEAGRMQYVEREVVPRIRDVLDSPEAHHGVLDVGCGIGLYLRAFRSRGYPVMGVEPAPFARARACDQNIEVVEDIAAIGGRRFGLVTLFDVLAHVLEPGPFVEALADLLYPGGRLVMTTPYRPPGVFRLAGALAALPRTDWLVHVPFQLHHFTQRPLRHLLEQRFVVERMQLMPEPNLHGSTAPRHLSRRAREAVKGALSRGVYAPRIQHYNTKLLVVARLRQG